MPIAHDCTHQGHVWAEGARPKTHKKNPPAIFARHRARKRGKVHVYCLHCPAIAQLEAHSANTAPPLPGAVPNSAQVPKPV